MRRYPQGGTKKTRHPVGGPGGRAPKLQIMKIARRDPESECENEGTMQVATVVVTFVVGLAVGAVLWSAPAAHADEAELLAAVEYLSARVDQLEARMGAQEGAHGALVSWANGAEEDLSRSRVVASGYPARVFSSRGGVWGGCGETFSSISAFDLHQRGDRCVPPASVGLVLNGRGQWGSPWQGPASEWAIPAPSNAENGVLPCMAVSSGGRGGRVAVVVG